MPTRKEMNKWDKEWKKAVHEKENCCQVCGKTDGMLYAHHLLPRMFKQYRWEVDNGMILCFQHHKVGKYCPHQNPIWFNQWLYFHKPEIFMQIKKRLNNQKDLIE